MTEFMHQRHKPLASLDRDRELVLVCAPLRSNVNLSRIVRAASCSGITRLIACGNPKIDAEIARLDPRQRESPHHEMPQLTIEVRRSLLPLLKKLKADGYPLVGLEQTTNSHNIHDYAFPRRVGLVIGNERLGLTADILAVLDSTVEIPVYGLPYSFNVATATSMALFEYCRQFPRG